MRSARIVAYWPVTDKILRKCRVVLSCRTQCDCVNFERQKDFFKEFQKFKGEVQSRITIILKERVKISLQIGANMMKIG